MARWSPLLLLSAIAACSGDGPAEVPSLGTLRVTVATTGAEPDTNGYVIGVHAMPQLDLEADPEDPLDINGSRTLQLDPGPVAVGLAHVSSNCSVAGANPRTVEIVAGAETVAAFEVACAANGRVSLSIEATGTDLDADGYALLVGTTRHNVGPAGAHTITPIAPGQWEARLEAAPNCTVAPASLLLQVSSGAATPAAFVVTCTQVTTRAIAFTRDDALGGGDIVVRRPGKPAEALTSGPADDQSPAWSPDGGTIAFLRSTGAGWAMHAVDAGGGNLRQLAPPMVLSAGPRWSPDGSRIAWSGGSLTDREIFVLDLAGGQPVNLSAHPADDDRDPSWSPDGTRLAFTGEREGISRLIIVTLSTGAATTLTPATMGTGAPAWSPDGGWIAFAGAQLPCRLGCPVQVHFLRPDGSGHRTVEGIQALETAWSPDGLWLAVRDFSQMWVVEVLGGTAQQRSGEVSPLASVHWAPEPGWILSHSMLGIVLIDPDRVAPVTLVAGAVRDPVWGPVE